VDKKNRKHYTPEQKAAIMKRRLVEHVPVSNLRDEYGYMWRFSIAGNRIFSKMQPFQITM